MRKSLWVPPLSSIGIMVLLYLIGYLFNISLLEFNISQNEPLINGLILDAEIALLPIVIGVVVGFIAERIVRVPNK